MDELLNGLQNVCCDASDALVESLVQSVVLWSEQDTVDSKREVCQNIVENVLNTDLVPALNKNFAKFKLFYETKLYQSSNTQAENKENSRDNDQFVYPAELKQLECSQDELETDLKEQLSEIHAQYKFVSTKRMEKERLLHALQSVEMKTQVLDEQKTCQLSTQLESIMHSIKQLNESSKNWSLDDMKTSQATKPLSQPISIPLQDIENLNQSFTLK
mmetsp:Transcript_11434/g.20682  ORF Transcript_11434/g.20682 Transcript_11434/m.20682 type:complete len:217 (-) Transcript_11434:4431-5081(-)